MNENIGSAGVRLDESKAFLRVEPFNDTVLHDMFLSKEQVVASAKARRLLHRCSGKEVMCGRAKKAFKQSRSTETRFLQYGAPAPK
jgi:hypothetical protein